MSREAFRRAFAAVAPGGLAPALVQGLGLLQVLVSLLLLAVGGLLLALVTTRGTTTLPAPRPDWTPAWLPESIRVGDRPTAIVETGLFPVAAANRASDQIPQRLWGRLVSGLLAAVPVLRSNLGALSGLLAVGLAGLLAITFLTRWRRGQIAAMVSQAAVTLRRQLHRQMYRFGQSALPNQGIEPLIDLFSRSVDDFCKGYRETLRHSLRAPVLIVLLALIALAICWPLTVALGSVAALTLLAIRWLRDREWSHREIAARKAAVGMRLLQEDLGLVRTVRVYSTESFENRRFDEHLGTHAEAERAAESLPVPGATSWLVIGTAVVLAWGLIAMALLRQPALVSPAGAVVLVLTLLAMVPPIRDLLRMRRQQRQAGRAAAMIYDYLDQKPELQQTSKAQFLAPIRQRISYENVTLLGPSGKPLLEGVNLEIPAGSRVAVMGREDEAKQAFVCLIPRLMDPSSGRVRIDGQDLRHVTLESLRAQVATVFQNDLVFSDSVIANIGLGDPSFTLPRITEAAKVAHAHHFIQDLPHGYETTIGALGHYLRADEKYRIALARAFLHDPSILIIEEPDVALDESVKPLIDDTIQRLAKGRTVIFLPHRLSTIRSCDQVVILHNGRLEAVGTPRDLQAASKVFRHLQYMEFNQFATGEIEAGQMSADWGRPIGYVRRNPR